MHSAFITLLQDASSRVVMATTMKAAVYAEPGKPMVVKDIPIPVPQKNQLLVKIVSASLCGSDGIAYKGYLPHSVIGSVGGHEGVGIVEKVHESVNTFAAGDRVGFLNVIDTCRKCIPCTSGEDQYCESGKRNPGFNADGFLAEYAIVDSLFSVKIPEKLPLEKLSPLFCAGITAFRAVNQINRPKGDIVGIFGLGGVGTFLIRFAVAMGFRAIGFDISPPAREAALALGAEAVCDSGKAEEMKEVVDRLTKNEGLAASIVGAGASAAYQAAFEYTGFKGTIIAVGVPHSAVETNVLSFVKKALRLQGTQIGNPSDLKRMIAFVDQHNIIPEIELKSISDAPELMRALASGELVRKVGITFSA